MHRIYCDLWCEHSIVIHRLFLSLCAQSREALEFSPVESFITVLRKPAAKDFASKNLPRRSAIQRQIKSFLQLPTEHKSCVRPCKRNYSGKCRYRFGVELWLQFYVYQVGEVPRVWRKLSATCTLLAAITTFAVNTSTVIITNSFLVVSTHPAVQASEVLRNGNHSKLCPYISLRSNL